MLTQTLTAVTTKLFLKSIDMEERQKYKWLNYKKHEIHSCSIGEIYIDTYATGLNVNYFV